MSDIELKASAGKYRIIGEETFYAFVGEDPSYYVVGEFDSKEQAFERANKERLGALQKASDTTMYGPVPADAYYVYDDQGNYLGCGRDFSRISKAIEFAMKAHSAETRKASSIPYIAHPLDVLSILLKEDVSEDLACAGVLHDATEDTSYTLQDIKQQFGDRVARLVEEASIPAETIYENEKKQTWRERKSIKIERVKKGWKGMRLLICADKLANIRDLMNDHRQSGDAIWKKFDAPKEDQEWYYASMISALGTKDGFDISNSKTYLELTACFQLVFGQTKC